MRPVAGRRLDAVGLPRGRPRPSAHLSGGRVIIVNAEPTEYDDIADVVVRGPISVVLPDIIGA